MREGEGDFGWTLRSVDRRSAVLENDGRMVTLDMPAVPGSVAGASAPEASSAPQNVRERPGPRGPPAAEFVLSGRPSSPQTKSPPPHLAPSEPAAEFAHVARANNGTAGGRPT